MNDPTREAVLEWLAKASNDWATVEILLASGRAPGETTSFHCQQYVEKLIKAVLTYAGVEAPKTHDLRRLIQLAVPSVPELSALAEAADALTIYGVQTRYPGDWRQIGPDEVDKAVRPARELGTLLLSRIEQWTSARTSLPQDEIQAFCRRHHIRRLALFGSAWREDSRPDSNAGALVDFDEGAEPGPLEIIALQDEYMGNPPALPGDSQSLTDTGVVHQTHGL